METPSQQQKTFYNILNQLLELLENNCNEGAYLEGAGLIKNLADNGVIIQFIRELRETNHFRHLERLRVRTTTTPSQNRKMEVCLRCGRCVAHLKEHQERSVCKDIYAERRNVAQGNAQVLQIIYNKRIDACDKIRNWWLSRK